jgi:glycine hydroxymethyltransferase
MKIEVAKKVAGGLSIFCATCRAHWDGEAWGTPCAERRPCGSPLVGLAFPHYRPIPGIQGGPHLNSIAALAVALKEASTAKFNVYGKQIVTNAVALADEMKKKGFKLVTDGTDSHLILTDMTPFGLLGNTMAEGCEAAGIVLNRNAIPFDTRSPNDPSGIRLGGAAETTRGRKEKDFINIAKTIDKILREE